MEFIRLKNHTHTLQQFIGVWKSNLISKRLPTVAELKIQANSSKSFGWLEYDEQLMQLVTAA